jgi:hypothetical protein
MMLRNSMFALGFGMQILAQSATSMPSVSTASSGTTVFPTATLLLQGNGSTGFAGAIIHASGCST